jgi:uncharacterized membrane protein
MGKKAQARRAATATATSSVAGPPLRTAPNWPLLALAVAGMALTGYMTWKAFGGEMVKGCSIGSACDIVLSSKWGKFLGMPTAFWGFLTYTALAATAFIKRVDRNWQVASAISTFGVLYSAYLTIIALAVLQAACPYCLTSLGIMTAIFIVTAIQRPAEALPNFAWPSWLGKTVAAPAIVILLLHLNYTGVLGPAQAPEDPFARGLADHLTLTGAKFYGAHWCPHCQQQKEFFGAAASRLPYIECSPNGGQGTPTAQVCVDADVQGYPTWYIKGRKIDAVLTPQQLAEASGFVPPKPAAN